MRAQAIDGRQDQRHHRTGQEGPRTCFYLSCEGLPPTVFDSQVIEHIQLMQFQGIDFLLIVFERLLDVPRYWSRNRRRYRELLSRLQGKFHYRVMATTFLGWDLWLPQLQLQRLMRPIDPEAAILVHARTATAALIALRMKTQFSNLRLVLDVRGDSPEEYLLDATGQRTRPTSFWTRWKFRRLQSIERKTAQAADGIICVSGALKEKLAHHPAVDSKKIRVIPTAASTEKFYWSPQLRDDFRKSLGIAADFVMVYVGSLASYQMVEPLVSLVSQLMEAKNGLHFLLVTPEVEQARSLLKNALPDKHYTTENVPHGEVVRWLNAADVGWLIRAPSAVNRVAAPTKFPEYLLCGLPVIISQEIGDYTGYAARERAGLILKDSHSPKEILDNWEQLEQLASPSSRQRIAARAKQELSYERYAATFADFYSQVCSSSWTSGSG